MKTTFSLKDTYIYIYIYPVVTRLSLYFCTVSFAVRIGWRRELCLHSDTCHCANRSVLLLNDVPIMLDFVGVDKVSNIQVTKELRRSLSCVTQWLDYDKFI